MSQYICRRTEIKAYVLYTCPNCGNIVTGLHTLTARTQAGVGTPEVQMEAMHKNSVKKTLDIFIKSMEKKEYVKCRFYISCSKCNRMPLWSDMQFDKLDAAGKVFLIVGAALLPVRWIGILCLFLGGVACLARLWKIFSLNKKLASMPEEWLPKVFFDAPSLINAAESITDDLETLESIRARYTE